MHSRHTREGWRDGAACGSRLDYKWGIESWASWLSSACLHPARVKVAAKHHERNQGQDKDCNRSRLKSREAVCPVYPMLQKWRGCMPAPLLHCGTLGRAVAGDPIARLADTACMRAAAVSPQTPQSPSAPQSTGSRVTHPTRGQHPAKDARRSEGTPSTQLARPGGASLCQARQSRTEL
eukprot:365728-Chlamydomonas_euryale.AAC.11